MFHVLLPICAAMIKDGKFEYENLIMAENRNETVFVWGSVIHV